MPVTGAKKSSWELEHVYGTVGRDTDGTGLLNLDEKWSGEYAVVIKLWRESGEKLTGYLQSTADIRRVTHTVEEYHRQIRKEQKKGVFTNGTALEKPVYPACRNIRKEWAMLLADWGVIARQPATKPGNRFELL